MKENLEKAINILNIPVKKSTANITELIKGIKDLNLEKSIQDNIHNINIEFNKTGAEIKDKLKYLIAKEEIRKQITKEQLRNLEEDITIPPTKEPNKYQLKNVANIYLHLLPKKYELCDEFDMISQRNSILYKEEPINEIKQLKVKYNNLVDQYIESLVEFSYIDTFINNLVDDNSYCLTPNQLVIFGF
jgi:hypothetical protein